MGYNHSSMVSHQYLPLGHVKFIPSLQKTSYNGYPTICPIAVTLSFFVDPCDKFPIFFPGCFNNSFRCSQWQNFCQNSKISIYLMHGLWQSKPRVALHEYNSFKRNGTWVGWLQVSSQGWSPAVSWCPAPINSSHQSHWWLMAGRHINLWWRT